MRKIILAATSAFGLFAMSAPAIAQIDVTIGMDTRSYFGFADQDTATGLEARSVDILRESEIHFNAEGKTDAGLTYGFHVEMEADGGDDANTLETSNLYLESSLGKLELGSTDGTTYKMQVSAPSADSNIDGVRQLINPVNYGLDDVVGAVDDIAATGNGDGFDYDSNFTGNNEKVSYFSPVWSGFQFGVSYTPDVGDTNSASGLTGFNADDVADAYGSAYEGALRYETEFNGVKIKTGAGYLHGDQEEDGATGLDDYKEWNVAVDLDIDDFGIGAVYSENNNGLDANDSDQIYVLGADYKIGAYKLGASYYHRDDEAAGTSLVTTSGVETDRYTGGVSYKVVDGFNIRGSVSFIENDVPTAAGSDTEATAAMVGILLNF